LGIGLQNSVTLLRRQMINNMSEPEKTLRSDIKQIELRLPEGISVPRNFEREHKRALIDLTKRAHFQPEDGANGPYSIVLSMCDQKLRFDIHDATGEQLKNHLFSLSPYRRTLKDYFMMIDSYEQIRSHAMASKLETIDMARRGLHNEAADRLVDRLKEKIKIDQNTARDLFTLICVVHLSTAKSGRI